MDRAVLLFEKKQFVATVTLNRATAKNAITTQMVSKLEEIRNEIYLDNDIRVIIIKGKETFSIGNDRKVYSSFQSKAEIMRSHSFACIVDTFNQPTIAAIRGDALGQGLELALACDLRVCTESARFAMNHIASGDIPWDGGTQRLSRVVGRGKAMEMILTGEVINAQEAHRIGLVHRVVPEAELLPAVMDMAREIASKSPIAVRYAKEALHKGLDLTLEQGLRLEADLYFLLHTTRDRAEGIRAFQEKRTPEFKGK